MKITEEKYQTCDEKRKFKILAMNQKRVLGLGNPLIDICAEVGPGYIQRWNLELNGAINANSEQLKIFDEIQKYFKVSLELGGCTLNTLRVFQWLSGKNRMATFSGAVGADLEGKNLSRRLKRSGLNCLLDVKTKHRTGKTVSLVTKNGNRSLVADISSADKYSLTYYQNHVIEQLDKTQIIYQSAWFILGEENFTAAFNLAKTAFSQGKDYVFNVGGSYICDFHLSKLIKIIPYANFIVANGDEFKALARVLGWSEHSDLNLIIEKLANHSFDGVGHIKRTVFCTQGDKETMVVWNGQTFYYKTLGIQQSEIVDTTAAGDSFCGGLLFIFSLHDSLSQDILHEAVECGHYCAREIIKRRGCSLSTRCGYFSWKNGRADLTRRSLG